MIKSLIIKNFVIIESIEIDFVNGLNIITGETGSGKSILIDALNILLGERAGTDFIRQNESKAVIEAKFEITKNESIKKLLEDNDLDYSDELILRREISIKGANRNFINDSPVTLGILKQISENLVDFHGQHDNQLLMNKDKHLDLLDFFCENSLLLHDYKESLKEFKDKISDYYTLLKEEKSLIQKIEFLKFQNEEIGKINPKPNEDEELENESKVIENSEFLHQKSNELYSILYDDENAVFNNLSKSQKIIRELSQIDTRFNEYLNEINSAIIGIKEISSFANDYLSKIEFNPEKIEDIRQRLYQLKSLMKKYGSVNEIIELYKKNAKEISLVENFDLAKKEISDSIDKLRAEVEIKAIRLNEKRLEKSIEFQYLIENSLIELGIQYPKFEVKFGINGTKNDFFFINHNNNRVELYDNGMDLVEFYISTNIGEPPKPLSLIASGGEVSRIMLSIKSHLAGKENYQTMVFDEIDTGISGRIAQKVGLAMKNLANSYQIISITHLAQIAALGDRNIIVEKTDNHERTIAKAKIVIGDERLIEIAKMLSGEEISESAINSARELTELTR